jgi:peroxiredoxin
LFGIAIFIAAIERSVRGPIGGVRGDQVAADFDLESLDGGRVSLASLRGKVVFLNFWATWCAPCRDEMPSMQSLHDEFNGRGDFVMLAVSQDERGRDAVKPFIEKNGFRFQVLLDPEGRLADSYGLRGVPETFIIDRAGRIVARHMGAYDWARPDVKEALRRMLEVSGG